MNSPPLSPIGSVPSPDLFAAAKALADELESQWGKQMVHGKWVHEPQKHFEVRVRDGGITILCRTATANGWHRIRNRTKAPWMGFAVRAIFETRDDRRAALEAEQGGKERA